MTILQINKFYYLKGGAERYLFELSSWLEEAGERVIPFAMAHPDNEPSAYARFFPSFVATRGVGLGWQALRTLGRMTYSLTARRRLAQLIVQTRPDVAHLHNVYTQLSPSILHALTDMRVPVVMTVHDQNLIGPQYNVPAVGCGVDLRGMSVFEAASSRFHQDSYVKSLIQAGVFALHRRLGLYKRHVDVFVAPSLYMKRQLVAYGFPEEKIRVVRYGIDAQTITPRLDNDGYVLFVGRLSEEKGIETVIELGRLLPDITFKIVGRGPDMDRLHQLAHGLKNVTFLGYRSGKELADLYRGAVCTLLPSRVHENAPLTALESMALGTPMIASDVGGVGEIVEDGVSGFLVAPTDVMAWAEAVMRLVHDEGLQDRMAVAARSRVERHFRLEDHFAQIQTIYRELTDSLYG